ncbi:MAG: hypothetical protein V2B13_10865, partial [Pseudomonadota bacterium]
MHHKSPKIMAPFKAVSDIALLKHAGAGELYCGYITEELSRRWPSALNLINRRGEGQSFEDEGQFGEAMQEALRHQIP